MKKIILYTVMASMICCINACKKNDNSKDVKPAPAPPANSIELTVNQRQKTNTDNGFAFNVFKKVSAEEGANTFFSPLSLNMALGMLYNGASGETRTEMAEALGMAGFSETGINEYYQKMSQALQSIDPLTEIGIANSIWYRNGFAVKPPFIETNQKYFDAAVRELDFNQPDAANIINQWCADKTKNRIEEIVDNPIPHDVVMYLINALYFKSNWQFEFDRANTYSTTFTQTDHQQKMVNMMTHPSITLPFYGDEHLTCVEIPYGNQAFSMVVMLPNNNMNIEQLIDYLDIAKWQNILSNMHERTMMLGLPRFKIECDIPLNKPVQNIGIHRIFAGGFDNISDVDLAVSNIKQKTFVEVNEEGTEAAAVTSVEVTTTSAPPSFFANRPFLYLIKEKSTGVILFIGRMDEPNE
jgi:serpin B